MLHNVITRINDAIINFRKSYCPNGFNHEFKIVLQQPESENRHRMWYILGHYNDKGEDGTKWRIPGQ